MDRRVREADVVFHSVGSEATRRWIETSAKDTQDLNPYYQDGAPRIGAYRATAEAVLSRARRGEDVVLAVYGHPCLLHTGVQLTLRSAREEGIPVQVLPGLSSLDGLLAAVGFDPGFGGLQVLEATDMLVYAREPQLDGHVVILQVACVGPRVHHDGGHTGRHADRLVEYLLQRYPAGHAALHFRLATDGREDELEWATMGQLGAQQWSNRSSLYLPPARASRVDPAARAWFDAR